MAVKVTALVQSSALAKVSTVLGRGKPENIF